jgi:hypothetical protein
MDMRRSVFALGAIAISVFASAALAADDFQFRLSPGSRLVGTRAPSSGSGVVSAKLSGRVLALEGTYQGLLGAPTAAHLMMGPVPGVRGPKIADLTISPAPNGTIRGSVTLGNAALSAFRKGGLYVEIDSAEAPEGDLWGWVMPPIE